MLKKAVVVPLRVFSLKRSTVRAFVVPFWSIEPKKMTGIRCCFELIPLKGLKNFKTTPTEQDLGSS